MQILPRIGNAQPRHLASPPRAVTAPPTLAVLIFLIGWCAAVPGFSGARKSDLSEVVEEAKRPVEDQGTVERDYKDQEGTGGGFGWLLGLFFGDASCEDVEYEEYEEDESHSESEPWFDEYYLTLTSVHVRPNDGVLASLTGGGVQAGAYVSPHIDAELSAELLWGRIDPESAAFGALLNPMQGAIAFRTRIYPTNDRILGLNGFVGAQYSHLWWKYANPVFAVEPDGYGLDLWDDSLGGISWFCGIGVAPLAGPSAALNLDLGVGWRTYLRDTSQGFRNDLFADAWYTQANLKLTFRF